MDDLRKSIHTYLDPGPRIAEIHQRIREIDARKRQLTQTFAHDWHKEYSKLDEERSRLLGEIEFLQSRT